MAEVTVSQFAEVLKVPVDRLLVQLDQAGIKVDGPEARISDDAKLELLTHLRRSHGSEADSDGAPRKITLKRKTQSELKLASGQGRARTVNIEVRRKRTYIKRDVLEEQARVQQDELDHRRREAEEAALIRALRQRRVHGAALDVFDTEPLPAGHPFYTLDNVLLSPHSADQTSDWKERTMRLFIDNFRRYQNGEPLLNVVNKKLGY